MVAISRRALLAGLAGATAAWTAKGAHAGTVSAGVPRRAAQGPLNLIEIVVEGWPAHWMGCYGNPIVRTPNVDALAARSALFLNAYPDALPVLAARRALYTGRQCCPGYLVPHAGDGLAIRGSHPLYEEDYTLAETLTSAGYTACLASDVYPQFAPDANFQRGFLCFRWVRGQEADRYRAGPRSALNPLDWLHPSQADRAGSTFLRQYLMNRAHWRTEQDWPAAQVFAEATEWLETSISEVQPFYLHVESYSPHEFWDPPDGYYELYAPAGYTGPRLVYPPWTTENLSPLELTHVRALYAGLVTFTDSCIGRLLAAVERLGLFENTVIAVVGASGAILGEQGQLHNTETRLRAQATRVPLIVYYPGNAWAGRRVAGLVQHTDVMPTLLDALEVPGSPRATGTSMRAAVEAGEPSPRQYVVLGWGDHASLRTTEWNYQGRWNGDGTGEDQLYDLAMDPGETVNSAGGRPAVTAQLRQTLRNYVLDSWGVTQGNFAEAQKP